MIDTIDRPSDRLTIHYKGEPRDLFMSYQRLNSVLRVVGHASNLPNLMVDPDVGEGIIRVMVAAKGSPEGMFDVELEEGDLSMDDFDKILMWARDHVTSFFVKRLQQTGDYAKTLEPMMTALKSSLTGLAPSSSSEVAAGPSA
ncbi:MAG: hypothetical protein ACREEW_13250 [Caulobacteraceae bacterium]